MNSVYVEKFTSNIVKYADVRSMTFTNDAWNIRKYFAVDPRSNPGSGSALLMSERFQAVYYISSCHMLID